MDTRPSIVLLLAAFSLTACREEAETGTRTSEEMARLERRADEALQRQRQLENRLAEQELAAQREALELQRSLLEQSRMIHLEGGAGSDAKLSSIREQELELAKRQRALDQREMELREQQAQAIDWQAQLDGRELELAGRQALADARTLAEDGPRDILDHGVFYEELEPYGSWFQSPEYGHVWQPAVARRHDWRPYKHGSWVCTEAGWTWVSDEPFGWATYHYGRWARLLHQGWCWVPASQWGPAWVSWRSNDTHIGWAPLPPETLAYPNRRWGSDVDALCAIDPNWYTFVRISNFGGSTRIYQESHSSSTYYFSTTVNITNIYMVDNWVFCGGPSYRRICQQSNWPPPYCRIQVREPDSEARRNHRIAGRRLLIRDAEPASDPPRQPRHVRSLLEGDTVARRDEPASELSERFAQQYGQEVELRDPGMLNPRRQLARPVDGGEERQLRSADNPAPRVQRERRVQAQGTSTAAIPDRDADRSTRPLARDEQQARERSRRQILERQQQQEQVRGQAREAREQEQRDTLAALEERERHEQQHLAEQQRREQERLEKQRREQAQAARIARERLRERQALADAQRRQQEQAQRAARERREREAREHALQVQRQRQAQLEEQRQAEEAQRRAQQQRQAEQQRRQQEEQARQARRQAEEAQRRAQQQRAAEEARARAAREQQRQAEAQRRMQEERAQREAQERAREAQRRAQEAQRQAEQQRAEQEARERARQQQEETQRRAQEAQRRQQR